jgi:Putative adhesin
MKTSRFPLSFFLAAMVALIPIARAHADESRNEIAFSDPSKPGTLKIHVWHGEVSIHGGDVATISVRSECTPANPTPRKDGMRVLSASAGYALSEKGNVAILEYGSDGWTGGSADFDITVPRNTSVVVGNGARGDINCDGISGDIDVRTSSGDVKLSDISGGALVEAMRGDINVSVKELTATRPLSFTAMRGQITMRIPADSKANIRFRTHRGVILTNFDDKALVTKTELPAKLPPKPKAAAKSKDDDGDDSAHAKVSVAINDSDSDGDWHAEVRDSIREAASDAAEAARDAAEAVHESLLEVHAQFGIDMPALPPMTGGKVVSGTLNGGGVEIQAATLSGDIELKKTE